MDLFGQKSVPKCQRGEITVGFVNSGKISHQFSNVFCYTFVFAVDQIGSVFQHLRLVGFSVQTFFDIFIKDMY